MSNDTDRMVRAGNYVLGLMNEADRERAERDLEQDASFRDAVLSVAERMRIIGSPPEPRSGPDERWKIVAARISDLPQMRGLMPAVEQARLDAGRDARFDGKPKTWRGPHAIPSTRAAIAAACLIATFAAGYLAGLSSAGPSASPDIMNAGSNNQP